MLNPETSFSPSGPISYTFQPDPAISEVDHITNNLRSLLEKLDSLKIEASSSSQTSPHCDFRRNGGCQAFIQNMVQATNDFQEFIKTDQLVRVPSIEQPNHENNETIVEGELTVSEIEDLVFCDEDKIEEDYENLFNGLSPISNSQDKDQTFSRDCYYLGEEDHSLNIPEDDENVFLQDHNVDTISMSNSHVDLVEVHKEEKCNQSSDGYDFSTDLSIEFDIQEDNGQNDSSEDDGMILKLLDKEPEIKKPKEAQSTFNTVDLGSNGEF